MSDGYFISRSDMSLPAQPRPPVTILRLTEPYFAHLGACLTVWVALTVTGAVGQTCYHFGHPEMPITPPRERVAVARIQFETAREFGVQLDWMLGLSRCRLFARPRMVAMFLCRELTQRSQPELGRLFHRDHTTILWDVRRITALMETDADLRAHVEAIRARLNPRSVP